MVKFVSQPLELYNTGTADALYLESSDAGSLAGPVITLKRNSPSPLSADYLGQLKFKGESSTGADRVYAKITAKINDATNGSESGIIEFMNRHNGSEQIALRLRQDSFRLLNSVNLFVDGNTGLGQTSASERLDVNGNIAVSGTVDGRDVATDGTNQDALQTLTGVSAAATDLGTFTGSTIADNVTVKAALQALEDAAIPSGGTNGFILAKASGTDYDTEWVPQTAAITSVNQDTSPALGGNLDGSSNDISGVDAYSGASLSLTGNITVDGTVDGRDVATDGTNQDALQTLTGIAAGTANLGTFTGSTIADSSTIKAALQALETRAEAAFSASDVSFASQESIYSGVSDVNDALESVAAEFAGLGSLATKSTVANADIASGAVFGNAISNNGVGIAKLAQIGQGFLANSSAANATPQVLSTANAKTLLAIANTDVSGLGTLSTVDDAASDGTKYTRQNGAWVAADSTIADANQTITATRTIDDGDNGHTLFIDLNNGGASTAQVLVNPSTPTVTLSANAGSAATTSLIQLNGSTMNLQFGASAGLTVNAAAGSDGQALVTSGAGAPPEWGGYTVARGTTAPTSPSDGDLWFNTTTGVNELFAYDNTRSKWLSASSYMIDFGFGGTLPGNSGAWAKLAGNRDSNVATGTKMGFRVPYDCTVIAWTFSAQADTASVNHRIGRWDESADTSNAALHTNNPSGTYREFTETGLNVDFDAGDQIGVSFLTQSATTMVFPNHTVVLRRRTS